MGRRGRRDDAGPDGVLVVDKPPGPTSHDVVARVRRLARTRRVGHAGTLDPLATGVLVLGLGRATRLLQHLGGHDKAYRATVRLGVTTSSDDAGGEVLARRGTAHLDDAAVRAALDALRGPLRQVPPAVSAVHVDGRRAHERVRAGEQVELEARDVRVHALEVLGTRRGEVDGAAVLDVDVEVEVSTGTYVRALARDAGAALGVGGSLVALRRTRSGPFGVQETVDPGRGPRRRRGVARARGRRPPLLRRRRRRRGGGSPAAPGPARPARRPGPARRSRGPHRSGGATATGADDDVPAGADGEPGPHGSGTPAGGPLAVLGPEGLVGLADLRDGVLRPRTVLAPPAAPGPAAHVQG